jgi:hypothetical protein
MRALLPALVLVLAGCNATMPQQQSRPTANDDPSGGCFAGIPINPELAAIAGKIPLGDSRMATLQMLSSKEVPTETEKQALSLWAKYRTECVERGRSFRARWAPPGWATAYENGQVSAMQAIAALYGGGTYGQFNVDRQRIGAQLAANLEAASRGAQQAEANQRASDQAASLQSLQTMQLLQSMQPRPVQLPMPAPTVYCNSQQIGNQVHTNCR